MAGIEFGSVRIASLGRGLPGICPGEFGVGCPPGEDVSCEIHEGGGVLGVVFFFEEDFFELESCVAFDAFGDFVCVVVWGGVWGECGACF